MKRLDIRQFLDPKSALSRQYPGMAPSEVEIVFAERFREQSGEEKSRCVTELIDVALDNKSRRGRRITLRLLSSVAMRVGPDEIRPHVDRLVGAFNDEENVRTWLNASEAEKHHDGPGFESEYGFALSLFTVLCLVAPERVEPSAERLIQQATSKHCRESLVRTREMMQRWRNRKG